MAEGNPYVAPWKFGDKNLFYFQDLDNPRLTWKLYSQRGGSITGPIATGFYNNNGAFSITHDYSSGMGDTIETAIRKRLLDLTRNMVKRSRDLFNWRYKMDDIKNSISQGVTNLVSGLNEEIQNQSGNIIGDVFQALEIDQASEMGQQLLEKANKVIQNFSIAENMEAVLKRGQVHTQGDFSKLFNDTKIDVPAISNVTCVIRSVPHYSCVAAINNLIDNYFLGTFNPLDDKVSESLGQVSRGMEGGYWTAPNNANLAEDNPLDESKLVDGLFTLRAGPYLFKNLLLTTFRWEYSKEFVAYPDKKSDGRVFTIDKPAYVTLSMVFDNYKYKTKSYLKNTYVELPNVPSDPDPNINYLDVPDTRSRYNENPSPQHRDNHGTVTERDSKYDKGTKDDKLGSNSKFSKVTGALGSIGNLI
jgi:hypothetical protein